MATKQPSIGDRVYFNYGAMCGDASGIVVATRVYPWARTWEVRLEDGSRTSITRYDGTAEDRGGYFVPQSTAIGTYLVSK